jgi:hypothetical protein
VKKPSGVPGVGVSGVILSGQRLETEEGMVSGIGSWAVTAPTG